MRQPALHRRAWVVQERLLPPRTLYYGLTGIYWECRHQDIASGFFDYKLYHSQNSPVKSAINGRIGSQRLDPISYSKQSVNDIIPTTGEILDRTCGDNMWESVLRAYCQCSLTFPTDKLTALMGVVDGISARTRVTFVAGLWKELFFLGLLWYIQPRYRKSTQSHTRGPDGLRSSNEA
jgi:hypothetical protein